jgi:serine/threonine protein kinase
LLILRKLRGTLNVVHLDGVFEDETHVHIVMEYCRGGELFHKMGMRHYSERTVGLQDCRCCWPVLRHVLACALLCWPWLC